MNKKLSSLLVVAVAAVAGTCVLSSSDRNAETPATSVKTIVNGATTPIQELACSKCRISNTEHTCGKCGGHMTSKFTGRWSDKEKNHPIYKYTCNKCGHSVNKAI